MNIVYYASIQGLLWDDIKHKTNVVSRSEEDKIRNKRFEKDRCLGLVGKLLLLHVLKRNIAWSGSTLPELSYNDNGKPYCREISGDFNISHSGDIVVCVYCPTGNIGVDIEQIQEIDLDDFKNILTPLEYDLLKKKSQTSFFRLWTQKEAIAKAEGKGFYLDPLNIDIGEDMESPYFENIIGNNRWYITTTVQLQGYALSVASSVNKSQLSVEKVDIPNLVDW